MQKNIIRLNAFLTVLLTVLFLSGCKEEKGGQGSEIGSGLQLDEILELEKIFDTDSPENREIMGAYGYGINNADNVNMIIDSTGDRLSLDVIHHNVGGECNIGWLVFIDGIPQYLDSNGVENYLPHHVVPSATDSSFSISMMPVIDEKFTKHRFDIACIFEPQYVGDENFIGYGNYGSELPLCPYEVTFGSNDFETRNILSKQDEMPVSEALRDYYSKANRDGTFSCKIDSTELITEFRKGDELIEDGVEIGEADIFSLNMFGNCEKSYRVSAFLNCEPYPVFDSEVTVEVKVRESKVAVLFPQITAADLPNKYNSLFFILVPISGETGNLGDVLYKSPSYTLIRK